MSFFSDTGEKKQQSKKEKIKERRERWLNSEYFFIFSSSLSRKENANIINRTSVMDMAGSLTPHPDSDACNCSGRSMWRVTQAPAEVIIIRI